MNHRLLSLSAGVALALAAISPAQAVVSVLDGANLVSNTVSAVANTATAIKMHYVIDRLDYMSTKDDGHYDEQNYYDVLNEDHNTVVANYNEVNNYYCGTEGGKPPIPGPRADGGEGEEGGGMTCGGIEEGEVIIPTLRGPATFGTHGDAIAYMDESRQVLGGVVGTDNQRFTTVMDGNSLQAQAVDAQVREFQMQSANLQALSQKSTTNMGTRMQAAFSNQLAAAQTGEMMQMRALMLADQNAQVVREQEAAARGARESVAASKLRAAPDLELTSVVSW